jgi:hypothetical protein
MLVDDEGDEDVVKVTILASIKKKKLQFLVE